MRGFIDAILAAISTSSLTDEEFELFDSESETYSAALYGEIDQMLKDRETISTIRDRLKYYFMSKGAEIVQPSAAKSNIYIGSAL